MKLYIETKYVGKSVIIATVTDGRASRKALKHVVKVTNATYFTEYNFDFYNAAAYAAVEAQKRGWKNVVLCSKPDESIMMLRGSVVNRSKILSWLPGIILSQECNPRNASNYFQFEEPGDIKYHVAHNGFIYKEDPPNNWEEHEECAFEQDLHEQVMNTF